MKKTIYVFVRNDLSYAQKVVQAAHAVLESTRAFVRDENRYKIVVFAAKSEAKLKAIAEEAASNGIQTVAFTEPDLEYQTTAIATEPLEEEKRKVFARYKLLSD
jgi:hypothetical protein